MKIYTKTGDKGTTGLIGGVRVSKHHIRIEAYGTVDELNSYLGLIISFVSDAKQKSVLLSAQSDLFTIGSHLASVKDSKMKLPEIHEEAIVEMENAIDAMDATLKPLQNFILPGGSTEVAHVHVARCICRRAERKVVLLSENEEVPEIIIPYLNRLSDYLFTLARYEASERGASEIPWNHSGR
jgi:cob(I)alamin adenosyltransferase